MCIAFSQLFYNAPPCVYHCFMRSTNMEHLLGAFLPLCLTQVSMLWKALLHRQVLTAMILELRAIQTTMLTEEDAQQSSFNSLEDDMWYTFPQSCSVLLQLKESQQREQTLLADLEAAKKAQQEAQQQLQQAQSQVQAAREAPPMATPSPSHRSMENGTLYSRTLNTHNPFQTDNSDSLLTLHSS